MIHEPLENELKEQGYTFFNSAKKINTYLITFGYSSSTCAVSAVLFLKGATNAADEHAIFEKLVAVAHKVLFLRVDNYVCNSYTVDKEQGVLPETNITVQYIITMNYDRIINQNWRS